jgi:hypothetical protein
VACYLDSPSRLLMSTALWSNNKCIPQCFTMARYCRSHMTSTKVNWLAIVFVTIRAHSIWMTNSFNQSRSEKLSLYTEKAKELPSTSVRHVVSTTMKEMLMPAIPACICTWLPHTADGR